MYPGTELRIDDLIGAVTPSGSIRVLCPSHPTSIRSVAGWNKTTGTVIVWVDVLIPRYQSLVFTFNLTNPLQGQNSPNVGIAGYYNLTNVFRRELMNRAGGNRAPLLVAGFVVKRIAQNTVSTSSRSLVDAIASRSVTLRPARTSGRAARARSGIQDPARTPGNSRTQNQKTGLKNS